MSYFDPGLASLAETFEDQALPMPLHPQVTDLLESNDLYRRRAM
jgi:hypothetical protein